MVTVGVAVFIIGAALWLLGSQRGERRSAYVEYVQSAPGRQVTPQWRLKHDLRSLLTPTVRERALWLIVLGAVAVMVGYHFEWWTFLAILLLSAVTVVTLGLVRLLFRSSAGYPPHFREHKHTVKLPDGTTIPFVVRIDWRLPRSLTKFDDETIHREVEARVSEWFVSLTLDPPKTEDDAIDLIKNVNSKLAKFLTPAVLPYGSYLNVTVRDVTPPSPQEKYQGIIIGVSE